MDEIEKMSKQKDYKSSFVPKSAKILEELNNISQNFLVKIKQVDDNIIKISVTKNLLFKICIKNLYNIYFKVKSIYNA
ncbi:TPA: hypothetical protein SHC97_001495 [Campylobacter coli]|nr:hypothetical protein [Campylobacter coli]